METLFQEPSEATFQQKSDESTESFEREPIGPWLDAPGEVPWPSLEDPGAAERLETLEQELSHKNGELLQAREKLLRLAAEFDNFRKRARRQHSEVVELANEELLKQLLPILDNLERALDAGSRNSVPESFVQGIELIHAQAWSVLERAGLELVQAIGQPFDPNLHEAVMRENSAALPGNSVVREIRRGYALKGKVIRHSMVSVSTSSSEAES